MSYGSGRVFKRKRGGWCVAYFVRGHEVRESVAKLLGKPPAQVTEREAQRVLTRRVAEVQGGAFVGLDNERRAVRAVMEDYFRNLNLRRGPEAAQEARVDIARLPASILDTPAARLQTASVEAWFEEALEDEYSPATINLTIGRLCAGLRYAWKCGRLSRVPYLPRLGVRNARQGFFERAEYVAMLAACPPWLADMMRVSYLTGARRGEVEGLRWEHVDRGANVLTFVDTKNGEDRRVPIEGDVLDVIERRWKARRLGLALVFHADGKAPTWRAWARARKSAGCPDKLFHDLRRTFARNELAAGVAEPVIMKKGGWKSRTVFLRYAIVSTDDMREATRRNEARLARMEG